MLEKQNKDSVSHKMASKTNSHNKCANAAANNDTNSEFFVADCWASCTNGGFSFQVVGLLGC